MKKCEMDRGSRGWILWTP